MLFATQLLKSWALAQTEAVVVTVRDPEMSPVMNLSDDVLIQLS